MKGNIQLIPGLYRPSKFSRRDEVEIGKVHIAGTQQMNNFLSIAGDLVMQWLLHYIKRCVNKKCDADHLFIEQPSFCRRALTIIFDEFKIIN